MGDVVRLAFRVVAATRELEKAVHEFGEALNAEVEKAGSPVGAAQALLHEDVCSCMGEAYSTVGRIKSLVKRGRKSAVGLAQALGPEAWMRFAVAHNQGIERSANRCECNVCVAARAGAAKRADA